MAALTFAGSLGFSHAMDFGVLEQPASSGAPWIAGQTSNVCKTPAGSCSLSSNGRIGEACWCATPNGPVAGKVAAR